jgi:hypothetical protein
MGVKINSIPTMARFFWLVVIFKIIFLKMNYYKTDLKVIVKKMEIDITPFIIHDYPQVKHLWESVVFNLDNLDLCNLKDFLKLR